MTKKTKEAWKTYEAVFDAFTQKTIFKLISEGIFEGLESPVSIGKESNVFTALTKDKQRVIVKIYRITACDFNRMFEYIKTDPRFIVKKNRRDVVLKWTRREFKNLLKAREAMVNAPKPIAFKKNVLVEELIGNEIPAPKLKDAPPERPREFFLEIIKNIKKLYDIGLVHGDLSAFNILNYRETPYFIDFSQGTIKKNPIFETLLERDINNIINFFKKYGIKEEKDKIMEKIKREWK